MKRLALGLFLVAFLAGSLFAFPRRVLVEEFTNASCGPCASAAPAFNAFLDTNHDNISAVVTHVWWPGSDDPWYVLDTQMAHDRVDYYGVTGVPNCQIDGVTEVWPITETTLTDALNARLSIESPIEMEIVTVPVEGDHITVIVTINSGDTAVGAGHKLKVSLEEEFRNWMAPNGQSDWHFGLYDMQPGTAGEDFTIDANDSQSYTYTFPWLNYYDFDNLYVTAWVQNESSHEVIQSQFKELDHGYFFTADPDHESRLVDAGEDATYQMPVMNTGGVDDGVDIVMTDSSMPEGWSYSFTGPDGQEHTDQTSATLAVGDSFTSDVVIHTAGTGVQEGYFTLTLTSQAVPALEKDVTFYVMTTPSLLIVNQSPGGANSSYYEDAITAYNPDYTWAMWNGAQYKFNAADLLTASVQTVIVAQGAGGSLPDAFISGLNDYVTQTAGNLIMSGNDVAEQISGTILLPHMGAGYQSRYTTAETAYGEDGDPIADGMSFALTGEGGADNLDAPCSLVEAGGTTSLRFSVVRRAAISYFADPNCTYLMGFPFETIADTDSRNTLMANILDWFAATNDVRDGAANAAPVRFALDANYPNPFNASTEIRFSLPETGRVTLSVFNLLGQEVARLADRRMNAGGHRIAWTAGDLPSGMYFCRLQAQGAAQSYSSTRKMMLVK